MMPRLQAEEALRAVRILQLSGGQFTEGSEGAREAMQTLKEWEEMAEQGTSKPLEKTDDKKEQRRKAQSLLGTLGVKIIQHPPKEEPDAVKS